MTACFVMFLTLEAEDGGSISLTVTYTPHYIPKSEFRSGSDLREDVHGYR